MSSSARFLSGSSLPAPNTAWTGTLVSKNALTVMQILAGPRFLAESPVRLRAQLPQSRPGALRPVLVRGETGQVLTDQSVNGGIAFGGVSANGSQDVLVHAERDILHDHSLCVTVWMHN